MDNWPALETLLGSAPATSRDYAVRAIFASTVTGSATVDGRSHELGNDLDTQLLLGLREWADVVFVGSATVRAEDYGGVQQTENKPRPARIAVATASMNFDWNARFFRDAHVPHIFLTPDSALENPENSDKITNLKKYGEILATGTGSVAECVTALAKAGFRRISCEGGPSIFGELIAAEAVDQFYLTLDPTLTSSVETPIVTSNTEPVATQNMRLESVQQCPDSTLFLRYGRNGQPSSLDSAR